MKRLKDTFGPEVTCLGEFDSLDEAVKQACAQLDCKYLLRGVLGQGESASGFIGDQEDAKQSA